MNVDEHYTADAISIRTTILATFAAPLVGGLFTLACWFVLKATNLPAFGGSNLTRGLATAGSSLLLLTLGFLVFMWIRDQHVDARPPRWRRLATYAVSYLAPAALVVSTLAIPLAATKLYLDGVTVDQGFRTQYLTRLTSDWHLHDMNYRDIPAYYPAMWFWLGGRFGNLLGLSGWETYQPWALVSISMMACTLVPLWQRLTSSLPVAAAIALVSTAIFLVMSPEEPYSGIVAIGAPVAAAMLSRALRGSKAAIAFMIVYLGFSAATYTVFTAFIALSVVLVAGLMAVFGQRKVQPIARLIVIGVGSMAIAAISWGPYLWAVLRGAPMGKATATHYLPVQGVEVPLPMLSPTLIGALCLIGVGYLVFRANDPEIRNIGITTAVAYLWIIASMIVALAGQTLLGFRLSTVIALLLATAGVLGLADFRLSGVYSYLPSGLTPERLRSLDIRITAIMVTLVTIAGISYAQSIPARNHTPIDLAYTDTDGYGERADRFPADSTKYYAEIDQFIQSQGHRPSETVVLSDAQSFLSFYPYWGFQALTSHYANPLGEFERRNAFLENLAVDSNSKLSDPQAFQAKLADAPWAPPEVFIFRGTLGAENAKWKYDIAEDIFPNNPNVRFRGVYFNPAVFSGWEQKQIGPFVVVVKPVT
ncbi:galactan 5-O-arabinofuranosyltransferase [Corynebacterium epidermidicanis]|uniref:Galactan 5-O-arabinofuranosyltransferase n=1 Tax=Corynebacterium epidermidicanis TaxID=1050174 RepID=A0A0G3GLN9_9CORY|nr:galactan 5-O-arabinofuranosyltransferase [Corynebacterium epidermidicanis]AKK02089.1 Arabinofuranosyltransferase N terminal/Arabinofuranosyltransferase A C terminal [Corynebacterium epidermidicanis]